MLSSVLLAVSILPFSNILFTVGFTVAERVLYIPSIAACAIMGRLFCVCLPAAWPVKSSLGRYVNTLLFFAWCGNWTLNCLNQSLVWRSAESLYRAGIDANPRNEKLHDLLATRLQNSGGNLEEALWHTEQAIHLNPEYWHAHATLGQLRSSAGDKSAAIASYQRALMLADRQQLDDVSDAPKVRLNLAVQLQDVDRNAADWHFRRLCSLPGSDPLRAMGLVVFGAFLESGARGKREPLEEAAHMYEEALKSVAFEQKSATHLRLGSVLRRLSRLSNLSTSGLDRLEEDSSRRRCASKSPPPEQPRGLGRWWRVWKCVKESTKTEDHCEKEIDLVVLEPNSSSCPRLGAIATMAKVWQRLQACLAKVGALQGTVFSRRESGIWDAFRVSWC